jgi:uncharacterized phage-associated protein
VLIPFSIMKVAQAASVLLRTDQAARMSRLRLLKLLYIADRELLAERGRPITGDRPVAMDHGPVLSRTYDLIKGTDVESAVWQRFLKPEGPRDVVLANDPGIDLLSRIEIGKLHDVATRFERWNDWSVAEFTHGFPEWRKNKPPDRSSTKIPLDDLLDATGMLPNKEQLLDRERAEEVAERIFGE